MRRSGSSAPRCPLNVGNDIGVYGAGLLLEIDGGNPAKLSLRHDHRHSPRSPCEEQCRTDWSAAQQTEDATNELLVILHVMGEEPEFLEIGEVDGAKGLSVAQASEGNRLEAGAARLGPFGDEDEVELRPLPAGEKKHRAVAPLVLHGDVLFDGRPILDLDEILALVPFGQTLRHSEVG